MSRNDCGVSTPHPWYPRSALPSADGAWVYVLCAYRRVHALTAAEYAASLADPAQEAARRRLVNTFGIYDPDDE